LTPPDDDRQLVAAVVTGGDERAFARLYDRHTPALYRLALRLTGGSEPEAEEITHDAWVRAVERLPTFEWRAALRTWLCAFVVRRWRERDRMEVPNAQPLEDLAPGADDATLRGTYDRLDLERAIAGLAAGFRQVFVLHDVEGYTHHEIADLLGIDPGTSKSQLFRARRALRQALEPPGDTR
jgi:RNA polymerase sigma-70 factor, ECF subfamily